ncbi:hypothetical protein V6N11_058638 [Hibiscus sabdariffa]|uniref:Uncharacterized protein n=1 Tax=Hibiscus sabdariffa TaxID=183260 RepID=A0ABR2U4U3_9ROSI
MSTLLFPPQRWSLVSATHSRLSLLVPSVCEPWRTLGCQQQVNGLVERVYAHNLCSNQTRQRLHLKKNAPSLFFMLRKMSWQLIGLLEALLLGGSGRTRQRKGIASDVAAGVSIVLAAGVASGVAAGLAAARADGSTCSDAEGVARSELSVFFTWAGWNSYLVTESGDKAGECKDHPITSANF